MAQKFRTDIEGLRAVAVVPIVAYHAGLDSASGGYTGVDIFFVLSGYLITSIILRELSENRFSLGGFFKRRFLRILPALVVLLSATLIFSAAVQLPSQIDNTANSAIAAAGFASNIFFWTSFGYFDNTAEQSPLLHTWSLGVEEQFYLFFPVFLLLAWRYGGRRFGWWIGAICLLSFVATEAILFRNPQSAFAFYMLPTRIWEFGMGALAAYLVPLGKPGHRSSIAALLGLALIFAGYVLLDSASRFPGAAALLPCAGTVLLIAFGQGTFADKILSTTPFRFLGRISYSLYLWHWPVIVFYRQVVSYDITVLASLGLIAASILFGFLSYRLVERPFLDRYKPSPPFKVIGVGFAGLASFVAVGLTVSANTTGVRSFPADVLAVDGYLDYRSTQDFAYQYRPSQCFLIDGEGISDFDEANCMTPAADRANFAVVGDSHAGHIWRAIAEANPSANVLQVVSQGCAAIRHAAGPNRCALRDKLFDELVPAGSIDRIYLATRWRDSQVENLRATVRYLKSHGVEVVVVGPIPEYEIDLPLVAYRTGLQEAPESARDYLDESRVETDALLRQAMHEETVQYVSPISAICPGGTCRVLLPDGTPISFDYGHFTLDGSRYLIERLGWGETLAADESK